MVFLARFTLKKVDFYDILERNNPNSPQRRLFGSFILVVIVIRFITASSSQKSSRKYALCGAKQFSSGKFLG
jgi:hypothetical protein